MPDIKDGRLSSIGVVIVNFNSGPLLAQCLEALIQQRPYPDKIIVVDNASEDGSTEGLPECKNLCLFRLDSNLGFAAANNYAFRHLEGIDLVLTLNPDAFIQPECLLALCKAADNYPEYDSFACRMMQSGTILDGAGDSYHISGLVWRRLHGLNLGKQSLVEREVFSACAGAALYRRSALEAVGGFDESFFCYVEDVDLGYRLRLLGKRCRYIPDAVVYHIGSAISNKYPGFAIYHGHRNLVWTYAKNTPFLVLLVTLPLHILMSLVLFIVYLIRGKWRVYLMAKLDAIKGLPEVIGQRSHVQKARCISQWDLLKSFSYYFLSK